MGNGKRWSWIKAAVLPLLASLAPGFACTAAADGSATVFENPVPRTVSPQAREFIAGLHAPARLALPDAGDSQGWRRLQQDYETRMGGAVERIRAQYQPRIEADAYASVPVLDIRPKGYAVDRRVLVFVHGGGYVLGSATSSMPGSVPLAADTGIRIISIDYTLAPLVPYDTMVDQVIAVIEALVRAGHPHSSIAVVGVSAGGGLATGSLLRMRTQGRALPAALVLWSPVTDMAQEGETFTTLGRYEPAFDVDQVQSMFRIVVPPQRLQDPVVSPIHGRFDGGFPATLIQGGTREALLSGFVQLYQAIDTQGGLAKLDLYEGMVHTFQEIRPELPESRLARQKCAAFLNRYLQR